MDIQLLPILIFIAVCLSATALIMNDSNKRK
jgi:cell division protein FtsL